MAKKYLINVLAVFILSFLFYQFTYRRMIYCGNEISVRKSRTPVLIREKYSSPSVRVFWGAALIVFVLFFFCFRDIGLYGQEYFGGIDAIVYRDRFLNATGDFFLSLKTQGNEPLYGALVYFVRIFTDNFVIFLVVYYAILLALALNLVRHLAKNSFALWGIMLAIVFPLIVSQNLMRNELAYFLVGNAFLQLMNKKYWRSILITFLAAGCHISAIVFFGVIILYFLTRQFNLNLGQQIALVIIAVIIVVIMGSLADELLKDTKYGFYFKGGSIAIGTLIQRCIIAVLGISLFHKEKKTTNSIKANMSLVLTSFIVFPVQSFAGILYRMHGYFDMIYLYFPSIMLRQAKKKSGKDMVLIYMFYGGLSILFVLKLYSFIKNLVSYGILNWRLMPL